ncbi:MAG TPA: SET domain-containing protein-lysine N-methyltransferase [Chitinophagales bacterium]|nr:SET domain-containing protein-lysine N-methyltransferase [Chitinophagales bacterium]
MKALRVQSDKEIPDKIRVSDTPKGKGLFANVELSKGTVITAVRGEHVRFEDTTELNGTESYCVQITLKDYVKPDPPFYYANHSCNPNCGLNENLELVTIRMVPRDEELVWDYSTSMLERHWVMKCECGDANCRGIVNDFDLLPDDVRTNYIKMGIVLPYIVEYLSNAAKENGQSP